MDNYLQGEKTFKIVLIEDSEDDIFFMEKALSKLKFKYKLKILSDGEEALNYFLDKKDFIWPDIIFLDLNLPKKNGFEVLKVLKSNTVLKNIPVIVLTSSFEKEDINQAYDNYANSYISKPKDFDSLYFILKCVKQLWFDIVELPKEA